MAALLVILLVFCIALPTSKSHAIGVHAGGSATDGEEHIDAVQVDIKDVFTNIIPEMNQRFMTMEVAASSLEKNQLNIDLLLDRIEQILHDEKYGRPDKGEPTDQIQHQTEPSSPYQQIEFDPDDQDKTGNDDAAVDTGTNASSSLVTDATIDHAEPNHSDQHEIVTAKVIEVDQARPTQPVKGDSQDVTGPSQQETLYLHPTSQPQSPRQQLPLHPPQQTRHSAKQQDQLQLQTSQQQEQLQSNPQQQLLPVQHQQRQLVPLLQLQQQVEQPQQREVGHELDELDEIIDLASGLTNNHHAAIKRPVAIKRPAAIKPPAIKPPAIKPPAVSRAFAMRPITWAARRRTKISPDLEAFDLNLIDLGGRPWLP